MRGHLIMSEKERIRKVILSQVQERRMSLVEASERLRISYRQTKRIWKRYRNCGDKGLVHRSRGMRGQGGFAQDFKEKILEQYRNYYEGFGPTFACEKLEELGWCISRETLRKWLISEGLWHRHRKRKQYRSRRERRPRFGDLLQLDGSIHRWFGPEREKSCLMNLVDDATGITYSLLAKEETTKAAMQVLKDWIEQYGIPKAIYVDLKTVYIARREKAWSFFGQACQRLGIEIIKAYSPQAKGRVERNHAVYQDRLVKEIRLQKLKTIEAVNQFLQEGFIEGLNQRFGKTPAKPGDGHVPILDISLDKVFIWEYKRQIHNDWTIRFQGKTYQLGSENKKLKPKQKMRVCVDLRDQLKIYDQDQEITYREISTKPKRRSYVKKGFHVADRVRAGLKGKSRSPWNRFNPNWLSHKAQESSQASL